MNEGVVIHVVTRVVEIVGTAIIVVGSFESLLVFLARWLRRPGDRERLFADVRAHISSEVIVERSVAAGNRVAVPGWSKGTVVRTGARSRRRRSISSRRRGARLAFWRY